MRVVRSSLLLLVGAALGGSLLLAHRVSQETGKSLVESFVDVPQEAQKLLADLRVRAEEAVTHAQQVYEQTLAGSEGPTNSSQL